MTPRPVTLGFACCECDEWVSVTVLCQPGASAVESFDGVGRISVPCPGCGEINRVSFQANGTLKDVSKVRPRLMVPTPSVN
jgi:hypothetical protein